MPGDAFNPDEWSRSVEDSSDACPSVLIWQSVCEGSVSEEAAVAALRHSLNCQSCSDLLGQASALQDSEASLAEEEVLRELSTSSEAGQRRLAAVMHRTASPAGALRIGTGRRGRISQRLLFWPVVALATAACVTAAYLTVPMIQPRSDQHLLALAYDKDRPSELRIPGSGPGPLASPTRGIPTGTTSSELLEAKLRAQQRFEHNPNDALLRQTLGEIAIVEHDGEAARRSLEIAEALDPQLPRLRFDMASAYFEIAETTGEPINYARAADLFSQYLESVQGKDGIALFDRGLCWQRQSVLTEASKDFKNALALESDPAWRREIERHLQQVEQKYHPAGTGKGGDVDLTPHGFLQASADRSDLTSDHYELYLDAAAKGWLTQRGHSQEADRALGELASLGLKHQDAWLHDWLSTPASKQSLEGDSQLSAAIVSNAKGDAADALTKTQQATRLYLRSGDRAGLLRAEVETVYSLNRMQKAQECLQQAFAVRQEPALGSYSWVRAHLQLEIASCSGGAGDIVGDLEHSKQALRIDTDSHLPLQTLRSRFFIQEAYAEEGSTSLAWKMGTVGLAESAAQDNPARTHAFLSGLEVACAALKLRWATASLAEADVDAASRTGNARDYGSTLDLLGKAQSGVGDFAGADRSFDAADRALSQTGSNNASAVFKVELEADRAASLALRGQLPAAMTRMAQAEQAMTGSGAGSGSMINSLHRYSESSALFLQAGQPQQALHNSLLAIAVSEETLAPLRTELQRRSWATRTAPAYEVAVQSLLDSGQSETALRLWEWHQVAGFRPADVALQAEANPALPVTPDLPRVPSGQVTLVFARVLDRYVAWSITGDTHPQVRAVALTATPARIDGLSLSFSRLCADRSSSLVDLGLLGRELYGDLLAPFETELRGASVVRLEVDDSLRAIPFAALPTPDGRYLVERQGVQLLPVWWVLHPALSSPIDRKMHLLVVNGAALPAAYDETREIASHFPNSLVMPQAEMDSKHLVAELPRADLFHYNGHGSTDSEQSGLMLGGSGSQELFTADSIAGLSLKRCRLAVLAACETDLAVSNRREDSENLPHALLNAGVSSVIATQWAIDSQSTERLMVQLYDGLSEGEQIATALQAAQQSLLKTSERHPYFWSAFRLFEN